jgi:hypothetical protein
MGSNFGEEGWFDVSVARREGVDTTTNKPSKFGSE